MSDTAKKVTSVCVFCSAADGLNPAFKKLAYDLGLYLGKNGFRLVYGGATWGLMGAVADGTLSGGGCVLGVLPKIFMANEKAHTAVTTLVRTDTMGERKDIMFRESDIIVVLPGGSGTMDELFEAITFNQLKIFTKPVVIINSHGYYDPILQWFRKAAELDFTPKSYPFLHIFETLEEFTSAIHTL